MNSKVFEYGHDVTEGLLFTVLAALSLTLASQE
jgi:hypothetical protein